MTKIVKKASASVSTSTGISYQRTSEGWGFHPLGVASKPSGKKNEVWVNFAVSKIRDPQMLACIARYLDLKDEMVKLTEEFGQRATELNLLTSPARASFCLANVDEPDSTACATLRSAQP
jgi:hypothetical protein